MAKKPTAKKAASNSRPRKVKFQFIKSPQFREILATGAFGGITPKGLIHVAFYNERAPIPQEMVMAVHPDGRLGDEVIGERKEKKDIVRNVEAGIYMDLGTARDFRKWLDEKIQTLEGLEGKQ